MNNYYISFFGTTSNCKRQKPTYNRPLYTTYFKNAINYANNAVEFDDGDAVVFAIFLNNESLKLLDLKNRNDCSELVRKAVIPKACEKDIYGTSFYQIGMALINNDIFVDKDDPWLKTSGGKFFTSKASKILPYDIDYDTSTDLVHHLFFNNLKNANFQINAIREYATYQDSSEINDDAIVILDDSCISKIATKPFLADLT